MVPQELSRLSVKPSILIIYFEINIKSLEAEEKSYSWVKPLKCPSCNGWRLWGHGFVWRYFGAIGVWLKRWRCPDCGAVHTMRPKTHWRRFQEPFSVIITSLRAKAAGHSWLKSLSRSKQQYWWQGFQLQISRQKSICDFLEELKILQADGIILSTHSLKYFEIKPWEVSPYLSLAVTPGTGFG